MSNRQDYLVLRRTRLAFVQSLYSTFYQQKYVASDLDNMFAVLSEEEKTYQVDEAYMDMLRDMHHKEKEHILTLFQRSSIKKPYEKLDVLFRSVLFAAGVDAFLGVYDKELLISEYLVIASSFFPASDIKFMNAILENFYERKNKGE